MKRQAAAAAKEALKVNESSETPHGSEAFEAATEQKESTAAQKRYAPPAATDGDSTMEADGSDTPCSGNIKGEGSGSSEVARRIITRGISQQKTPAATQKSKGKKRQEDRKKGKLMQRMNSQSPHWDKNDKEQLRETPGQGQEKDEETRKKLKTKSW